MKCSDAGWIKYVPFGWLFYSHCFCIDMSKEHWTKKHGDGKTTKHTKDWWWRCCWCGEEQYFSPVY